MTVHSVSPTELTSGYLCGSGDKDITGGEVCASLEVLPPADQLAAMWRGLECRADATFFTSWEWIGTWLAESGARPLLLIGRRAREVVALGLLQRGSSRLTLASSDTLLLHQTGSQYFDCIDIEFNDFLLDRTCQDEARKTCLDELLRVRRNGSLRWGKLIWAASPCRLDQVLKADFRFKLFREAPSPLVDVGMLRRERLGYLEYLSANTRYNVRRSMRLYDEWGPLQLSRPTSVDEGLGWLDELRRLHEIRWQAKGKGGAFANPFFGHFLRRIMQRSLREHWDMMKICAGSTAIGYLFNFVYGGMAMNYQSGFLYGPDGRYKPGLVSHVLAVQHYLDQEPNVDGYSFLGGNAQYKRSLATSASQLEWYSIQAIT